MSPLHGTASLTSLVRHDRIRAKIEEGDARLPILPELAQRVLTLVRDPDTEVEDVTKVVEQDPGFVVTLLKLVNSPLYGLAQPVTTIEQGVMVIGFQGLGSLSLTAGSFKHLARDYRCYGHDQKGLWKHSVCVAVAARAIAKALRWKPKLREEIYIAGLLHDVGKVVLAPFWQEAEGEGMQCDPQNTIASETAALGIDHEEAGSIVAERWDLGATASTVIGSHEAAKVADEHLSPRAVVHLADAFAHDKSIGYKSGLNPQSADIAESLEILKLDEDDWVDLKIEVEEALGAGMGSLSSLDG